MISGRQFRIGATLKIGFWLSMHRITASVRGRVQGVSFRYYTQREAHRLNLTGWVRNELDGSVMVVAEGRKESLAALVEFLRKGPRSATVDDVELIWSTPSREYEGFEVLWL